MEAIESCTILWKDSFRKRWCVKLPLPIGEVCVSTSGSIKVLKCGSKYFIELELSGNRAKFEIAQTCYPALEYGVGRFKVCVDPKFVNGELKRIKISGEVCLGIDVDSIDLEECWEVIRTHINFFHIDELKTSDFTTNSRRFENQDIVGELRRSGREYIAIEVNHLTEEGLKVKEADVLDMN